MNTRIGTAAALLALLWVVPVRGTAVEPHEMVRRAIVSAMTSRIPSASLVDVQLQRVPDVPLDTLTAEPAPGARLGKPMRFVVSPENARSFTVVATVRVTARHVVTRRAVTRGAALGSDDVEWRDGPIEDLLVEALPGLDEVVTSHARRALAVNEVLTRAIIAPVPAVRAGDVVSAVVRFGVVEARGEARAVSSGAIGDVIRVSRPGSRDPLRARVLAAALVEILP